MPMVYGNWGPGVPGQPSPALDALRHLTASPGNGGGPNPRRLTENDSWGNVEPPGGGLSNPRAMGGPQALTPYDMNDRGSTGILGAPEGILGSSLDPRLLAAMTARSRNSMPPPATPPVEIPAHEQALNSLKAAYPGLANALP